jgi:enolase-phosphatase E1
VSATRFRCGAIVTDIEGTTGSTAFVRDVLFPYAQDHMADYVARHRDDPEVVKALHDAALDAGEPDAEEARIIEIMQGWIAEDRKITPLKTLQGLIWSAGYAQAAFHGHVYPDAANGLRRWRATGIDLYVYSSGSIEAQKLLFGNSTAGNLLALFSGFFDTTIGPKTEAKSYHHIADAVGMKPDDILFLSDREVELVAAHKANFQVACLARPHDTPPDAPASVYPTFTTFDDIDPQI